MQRQALETTHNHKEITMKIVKLMLAAVTAGLLALAIGSSGVAIVVAMGAGLGLTVAAGLGGRSLAWRRLLRAAADHDVDMAMLERAMVLVERDGIDGAVALQQVRQPLAIGP